MAARLNAEGADKTWDQCRIKLKNLKSQYRYIKERVPSVGAADLEDDTIMRTLAHDCQACSMCTACSVLRINTSD